METRSQCLGAGQSHDVCRSQCISSAGRGGVAGGGRTPVAVPLIQSSWTCNTRSLYCTIVWYETHTMLASY